MNSTFQLPTVVLSTLGQRCLMRTSELVAATGASRPEVLKALRSLERRGGVFKSDNGDGDNDWRQRGGKGRYTDALWQVNGENSFAMFADIAAVDRIVQTRGNLFTLLDNAGFVS